MNNIQSPCNSMNCNKIRIDIQNWGWTTSYRILLFLFWRFFFMHLSTNKKIHERIWTNITVESRNEIVEYYGKTIFNFRRNILTFSTKVVLSFIPTNTERVPVLPHLFPNWLSDLLLIAILTRLIWNLKVVLICINIFYKYLWVTYISFESCLFNSIVHLLIGTYIFLLKINFHNSL